MIENKIQSNIPLGPLTTFKIGGPAKYYIEISEKDELKAAILWCEEKKEKYFILGGGSNLLVSDEGFNGLVINIANRTVEISDKSINAGAGASLAQLVTTAIGNNLTGLEWAIGIPGTVGGAVRGNAGAFGYDFAGIVETVEFYDIKNNIFVTYNRENCRFDYRHSVFKDLGHLVIWEALVKLETGEADKMQEQANHNLDHRIKTQPKLPSAGSIFKNFLADDVRENNISLYEMAVKKNIVRWNKIAAGWVIGQMGIAGKKIGGAKLSLEHNNFIVNTGNARAEDVVMLISYIKQQVRDELKLQLMEEIVYVGFD